MSGLDAVVNAVSEAEKKAEIVRSKTTMSAITIMAASSVKERLTIKT